MSLVDVRTRLVWERRRLAIAWRASRTARAGFRFFARELLERRCTRAYRLRASGLTAVIRHPGADAFILYETFARNEYAIPTRIKSALDALERPVRVLDLGANVGLFGLFAHHQFPGAKVVSFEPDPSNLAALRQCRAANPALDWTIVGAAAGTADGDARFVSDFALSQLQEVADAAGGHVGQDHWLPPSLKGRSTPRTVTVEVRDVFPYLRECDLLKIDIEGAEWAILQDNRFADTSAIAVVIEAHPNARDDAVDVLDRALAETGLEPTAAWSGAGTAVVWAHR